MSKGIKNFEDVRNMNDKELANWLTKIWKTGYNVARIGSPISNCPDFYEKLDGKEYNCTLLHGDECISNNDCSKCNYSELIE